MTVSATPVVLVDPTTGLQYNGTGTGGGASTTNANPGTDSTQATAVQGVTGGKPVPVSQSGTWTEIVTQATAANLNATIVGTVTANIGTTNGLALASQLPASLGAKTSATSFSVAPATDATFSISAASLPLPSGAGTAANQATQITAEQAIQAAQISGAQKSQITNSGGTAVTIQGLADGTGNLIGLATTSQGLVWSDALGNWSRQRGTLQGTATHAPQAVPTVVSGTIATSGTTVALTFTNVSQGEVINPSTATLWASWGTPTVNGAGSFPIAPGGSYTKDRVAGTLTLLSTATSQTYTFNKFG